MGAITEACSVCSKSFEVQFRYQMEEQANGFAFFCSQTCLKNNQTANAQAGVTCSACAKVFQVSLVSQVFYAKGVRHYACSMECRSQILHEQNGISLGEIAVKEAFAPKAAPQVLAAAAVEQMEDAPADADLEEMEAQEVAGGEAPSSAGPRSATPVLQAPWLKKETPVSTARPGMPRVVAIFNHKGGTGKTTTSVSIAAGLAARGKRVLLVDTDSQGNVAVSLNANSERSLYHVLVMGLKVKDCARPIRPNLDLLPSNETLAAAELYLAGRQSRDRVLRDRLSPAIDDYDFIILDCSPSLSLMNQNALVFADSVLIPVACDYLSLIGVRQVIKTVKHVNTLLHHPVQIWGVLPTFFDARAKISKEAIATLEEHFGDRCLRPIRVATRVKEAPAHGQTIYEYAGGSTAAEDYVAAVDAIVAAREGRALPSRFAKGSTETQALAMSAGA